MKKREIFLTIEEIVVHVKKEIMRDLFTDIDSDYCVLDLCLKENTLRKPIARVSQYFLDEIKTVLEKIYLEEDDVSYRKYMYENSLDLYLKQKYSVNKIDFEFFTKDTILNSKHILKNINSFVWQKEVRVNSTHYKTITNTGDEFCIVYENVISKKKVIKKYKILFNKEQVLYENIDIERIVEEIEDTHPELQKAKNIIVLNNIAAYRNVEKERRRRISAAEKKEKRKQEQKKRNKRIKALKKSILKEYCINGNELNTLINKYQNKCSYLNKKGVCRLSSNSCAVLEDICNWNENFVSDLKNFSEQKKEQRKELSMCKIQSQESGINESTNALKKIEVRDFVVRRNLFKCIHETHEIKDIAALITVVDNNGRKKEIKISAGYCPQCNTYFIMESIYQNLKNQGVILCRITDEKTYLKGGVINGSKLAQESILMQYGYNVSQVEGLTARTRQKILAVMIDNRILSKNEIINYLDFFIRQRSSMRNMELAISKWEDDRDFVEYYRIGEYTEFGVNAIYRK